MNELHVQSRWKRTVSTNENAYRVQEQIKKINLELTKGTARQNSIMTLTGVSQELEIDMFQKKLNWQKPTSADPISIHYIFTTYDSASGIILMDKRDWMN